MRAVSLIVSKPADIILMGDIDGHVDSLMDGCVQQATLELIQTQISVVIFKLYVLIIKVDNIKFVSKWTYFCCFYDFWCVDFVWVWFFIFGFQPDHTADANLKPFGHMSL